MLEKYADDLQLIEAFPNGKLFRLLFDSSVGKLRIVSRSYDAFEHLRDAFSAENSAAFFVKQYGYRAEPKVYAINKFGYFGSGLVWEVLKYLKQQYGDLSQVAISKQCKMFLDEQLTPLKTYVKKMQLDNWTIANIADDSGRNIERKQQGKPAYEFRDYQENSIKQLLLKGYGRGLIEIPTAGGKSFILANFCWNLHKQYSRNLKYLLLVPNKQLVNQMYSDFIDYGYDKHLLTKFTAGLKGIEKYNPEAEIIIANRQYVFKNEKLLPKVDVLICDECHQCCSEATMSFIERVEAPVKIGCSGTIPRDKMNRWKLLGMFSQIVCTEDIVDLQKRGFISSLKITALKIVDSVVEADTSCLFNLHTTRKFRPDENGYSDIAFDEANKAEGEYFSKHYKDLYKPVFEHLKKLGSNTLILFDRIDIGQNLFEYAKELYADEKNVYYIDGSIDVNERERVRASFEKSDGNLLLAQSSIMSTGVNIKRLTNLIFLTGSKSFSRVIQSIGRTLRLHDSKTEAHVIDVSWNFKYSQRHYKERLKLYKDMYHKSKPDEQLTFTI